MTRYRLWMLALGLVLAACENDEPPADEDLDGHGADVDCDDDDPEVGGPTEWYPDGDGDGSRVRRGLAPGRQCPAIFRSRVRPSARRG